MQQIIKILKGNAQTSITFLGILGWLGFILGLAVHFTTWYVIKVSSDKNVTGSGLTSDLGIITLVVLGIYALFLALGSGYTLFWALAFFACTLEQVIGTHLLRYMPLESTKLLPALYLYLPISAILLIVGAFSPILKQIKQRE